jgi:hypothetical protein
LHKDCSSRECLVAYEHCVFNWLESVNILHIDGSTTKRVSFGSVVYEFTSWNVQAWRIW